MMPLEASDVRRDVDGSVLSMLRKQEESRPTRVDELQQRQKSTLSLQDAVLRHCAVASEKVCDVRKANLPRTAFGIFRTALARRWWSKDEDREHPAWDEGFRESPIQRRFQGGGFVHSCAASAAGLSLAVDPVCQRCYPRDASSQQSQAEGTRSLSLHARTPCTWFLRHC